MPTSALIAATRRLLIPARARLLVVSPTVSLALCLRCHRFVAVTPLFCFLPALTAALPLVSLLLLLFVRAVLDAALRVTSTRPTSAVPVCVYLCLKRCDVGSQPPFSARDFLSRLARNFHSWLAR